MWTLLLILPGLIAAYLIFLRPVLKALPALKGFYTEADTFRQKAWALCGNSLTVAWSYFLMIAGGILNQIDPIAAALGDADFRQQVAEVLNSDPRALGYFAMTVSALTIAARLRSIAKG
jgi:hypothetical protein